MLRALVLSFALLGALPAAAQDKPVQLPEPAPPSPSPVPPHCSDFRLNADGTWSPVRRITVGDVTVSQEKIFAPGSRIGGVDLATVLNRQCLQQS